MSGFDDMPEGEMEPEGGEAMPVGAPGFEEAKPEPHPLDQLRAWAASPNIAADIDPDTLSQIGARVLAEFEIDDASRADWKLEAQAAMEAVLQKTEPKNYPFEGASNVKFPVLTTAVLQFGARTYPAIVPGDRIVRAKVMGPDRDGRKQARAERVALHMSYQLLKEVEGWEEDMDTMVHQLPAVGHAFKKVYFDYETGRPCVVLRPAMNVVVNNGTTRKLETVPRITDVIDDIYPYQIEERIRAGTFIEFEYGAAMPTTVAAFPRNASSAGDVDAPHTFLEQHRYEDLDGDGLREPWIVTVHKDSGKVVRVVAGYDLDKAQVRQDGAIVRLPRRTYFIGYPFLPDPNGGYYGIGFGRLLRTIGAAVDTTLNQIIDAAHLQNAGGGFIGSGLNTKKATMRVAMNTWTNINAPGKTIRDAIVPHQFAGPSPVLFQVLGMLIDAAKQISSVQDVLTGEARAQTMQPTTLLALIEQGLKVYTSIIKRIFRSLSREFALLFEMNRANPDEDAYARIVDWSPPPQVLQAVQQFQQQAAEQAAQGQMPGAPPSMMGHNGGPPLPPELAMHLQPPTMADDYDYLNCDIVPVADPSAVTDMQKMAKAQLIEQNQPHPNMNKEAGLRRILMAANVEDIDQLITPTPAGPDPLMAENAKAEIEKKRAGAMKDLALAEKASVETQGAAQVIAVEHANVTSGRMDADHALNTEMQRLTNNKTELEMQLKQRQHTLAEQQAAAQASGEAT